MRTSLATFRRHHVAEETMMRAVMPRTSRADPVPLLPFAQDETGLALRRVQRQIVGMAPLTFTMAEAAQALAR